MSGFGPNNVPWYARYPEGKDPTVANLLWYEAESPSSIIVASSTVPALMRRAETPFQKERLVRLAIKKLAVGGLKLVIAETLLKDQPMDELGFISGVFPPGTTGRIYAIEQGKEPDGVKDFTLFSDPPPGFEPAFFYRGEKGLQCNTDEQEVKYHTELAQMALDSALGYGQSLELLDELIHKKLAESKQYNSGTMPL